jgi:hypothetical protein
LVAGSLAESGLAAESKLVKSEPLLIEEAFYMMHSNSLER